MPRREQPVTIGARRSQLLRLRLAEQLVNAKEAAGLSVRELARRIGISHVTMIRLLRGEPRVMTVDRMARAAAVVGLQLAASLYPNGDPVRDRAHLALLRRLKERISDRLRWRTEVPIPIAGDPRSGDAVIGGPNWDALVEAETRIGDIQLIERKAAAKQRDLATTRLILLVADTPHNRAVVRLHPELGERFPVDTRTCLRRLSRGEDPGGDALVVL